MNQELSTIVENAISQFRGNSPYVEFKKMLEVARRKCGYQGTNVQMLNFLLQHQNFALIEREVGPDQERTWFVREIR